jgi:hypothetical protein
MHIGVSPAEILDLKFPSAVPQRSKPTSNAGPERIAPRTASPRVTALLAIDV